MHWLRRIVSRHQLARRKKMFDTKLGLGSIINQCEGDPPENTTHPRPSLLCLVCVSRPNCLPWIIASLVLKLHAGPNLAVADRDFFLEPGSLTWQVHHSAVGASNRAPPTGRITMTTSLRRRLIATAVVCCLGGVAYSHPEVIQGVWPEGPQPQPMVIEVMPPDPASRTLTERIKYKAKVVTRLVNREINLFEAAALFRDANAEPPEKPNESWRSLPGKSDGEKLCRQVIYWVSRGVHPTVSPGQGAELAHRLEKELNEYLKEHEVVTLPD